MINLGVYRESLDQKEMEDYAGVRFERRECLKEFGCRTKPPHENHSHYEQILLHDEVAVPPKKDGPTKVGVTIRWFNFCWAYYQILLLADYEKKMLTQLRAVTDALVYARLNCFDVDGSPSHMARNKSYNSYGKFNDWVANNISELEPKVFKKA
jgi:hypothetical protein